MDSKQLINPYFILKRLWGQRELIAQLTRRDIISRYKGSYLGLLWSLINPLFMLTIYTFVFSTIFKARWGSSSDNKLEFAMVLFCGLIAFNIFAEAINRAPGLILSNVNFVKKVVFPLEILPIVMVSSALFNGCIGFIALLAGVILSMGTLHWTILLLPLALLPLIFITLGLSWLLASIGVFFRDVGQVVGVLVTAILFATPIFYPITAIPENIRFFYNLNPLTYIVDNLRRIFIWGQMPNWKTLLIGIATGLIVSFLGHLWFQKTKQGFPDVI